MINETLVAFARVSLKCRGFTGSDLPRGIHKYAKMKRRCSVDEMCKEISRRSRYARHVWRIFHAKIETACILSVHNSLSLFVVCDSHRCQYTKYVENNLFARTQNNSQIKFEDRDRDAGEEAASNSDKLRTRDSQSATTVEPALFSP